MKNIYIYIYIRKKTTGVYMLSTGNGWVFSASSGMVLLYVVLLPRQRGLCSHNHQLCVHSYFSLLLRFKYPTPLLVPLLDQLHMCPLSFFPDIINAGKMIDGFIIIKTRKIDPCNHESRSDILKISCH